MVRVTGDDEDAGDDLGGQMMDRNAGAAPPRRQHPIADAWRTWWRQGPRVERDPDRRPTLDTLDDWILFGPRMR